MTPRTRLQTLLLGLLSTVGLVIGLPSGSVAAGGAEPAQMLYVSPDGSNGGRCTRGAPCASFDRAYDIARPGQSVAVAAGRYRPQTITGQKRKPRVVFRLSRGARVPELRIEADNLVVQGGKVDYWEAREQSDGFVARGVDTQTFGIYGSTNTSVVGGDVGPSFVPGGVTTPVFVTIGAHGSDPRNIVFDGIRFHDFRAGKPDDHIECVHVVAADGLTIRGSRFLRCDIFSIFFTQWAGPNPPHDILLENNWFDESTADGRYGEASYSVMFAAHMDRLEDIVVRYNSYKQPVLFEGDAPRTNVSVTGNLGVNDGCDPRVRYSYNVWQWDNRSAACSPTDRVVSGRRGAVDRLGFVAPDGFDLRLTARSPAIDRGDPRAYPRRDILGARRPRGRAPDAGAVEAR